MKLKTLGVATLLLAASLVGCMAPARRVDSSASVDREFNLSYSGIAPLGGQSFVVVHDAKGAATQPRIGVLTLPQDGAAHYEQVAVSDWRLGGRVPDDLESVCALPGRPGEFLAAESGRWITHAGQLLHIEVRRDGVRSWRGEVLHATALPASVRGGTPDVSNYEGLGCRAAPDGSITVLLGERGDSKSFPEASIWIGRYEAASGVLQMTAESARVTVPLPQVWQGARARGIADLALDTQGRVWAVATQDPGDRGPFRSIVYQAGTLQAGDNPGFTAIRAEPAFRLDGIKVEGLAVQPDGSFVFASDDESFGGAFGTLPPPTR